jgi:hypothetical protein
MTIFKSPIGRVRPLMPIHKAIARLTARPAPAKISRVLIEELACIVIASDALPASDL